MSFTLQDSLAPAALTMGRTEAALAGETLANRYEVLELLGAGGMGAVYRVHDRELDEIVALKVIRKELAALPAMVARFRHEVKLARRVTHVNVARTFELGTADGLVFCTMELIEGESLARRVAQRGALPIGEAVAIACALCDGLAAAHAAGVIHRDIKPDNILLAHGGRVVLADFGVAAIGLGSAGELSGTPAYMAPEQARGEPATAASDVYSVGVVLYELLVGSVPFVGDARAILAAKQTTERVTPSADHVPVALATVIANATARDPAERIASARALRRALESWAGPLRSATQPMRAAAPAPGELTNVVVIAPRATSPHPGAYIATAVQEELLARLTKKPRLRVLPRVDAPENLAATSVRFELDANRLEVSVAPVSDEAVRLSFPLDAAHVHATVEAIVSTLEAGIARAQERDDVRDEAYELLLQARHIAYRDFARMPEAVRLLERARERVPDDPRIAASLAIAYTRAGFFIPSAYPNALDKARVLAHAAVTAAPDLADAHIACGHLELNVGTPVRAASHFRIAIARAPHLAEAHEQLGRMLLEAGYLDAALARLDEALAIAPDLRSANWEIARARALDGNWEEHDRLIHELTSQGLDRPLARARFAWWRGDWATVEKQRELLGNMDRILWPGVVDTLFDVFLRRHAWSAREDAVFAAVRDESPHLRRRVFVAQLACEAAAFAGDTEALVRLLGYATDDGLFDLHLLDHCVLLAPFRDVPAVVALRARIAERANAILDALYGDHAAALSATLVA